MGWIDSVDWSASGAWFQGWAGFANAAVIAWAAFKGSQKFGDWLRQKQTERKLAAAERIMTVAYKLKKIFPSIRSPFHSAYEIHQAEQKLLETYNGYAAIENGEKQRLKTAQVFLDKIASHKSVWDEYFECIPLVMAFFGEEAERQFGGLWRAKGHIQISAQMYGAHELDDERELVTQISDDLWEGMAEARGRPDRVSSEISASMAYLEENVLPTLAQRT